MHPSRRSRALPLLAALLISTVVSAQVSQPPTLSIDVQQVKGKVSAMLYGLMTEEINSSYDGGLYAELLRNRAFQDNRRSQPFHWFIYESGNSDALMTMDTTTGPSAALPLSLALTIRSATSGEQAGISNEGFWGIPVRPNTVYQGSFYAKAADPLIGPIAVSLIDNATAKVLAATTVPTLTSDWKQYSFTLDLDAGAASANNRLVLSAGNPGKLWFSLVSLFPPTYHDRANGNRIDLMEMLAAMHPAFLRFPGGNYLEGNHINERFQWEKTNRPGGRSPHPSESLGLPFIRWTRAARVSRVV